MFDTFGPVMSVKDVCEALMVGKRAVYELIRDQKVSSFRTGNTWKITRESLVNYVINESHLNN